MTLTLKLRGTRAIVLFLLFVVAGAVQSSTAAADYLTGPPECKRELQKAYSSDLICSVMFLNGMQDNIPPSMLGAATNEYNGIRYYNDLKNIKGFDHRFGNSLRAFIKEAPVRYPLVHSMTMEQWCTKVAQQAEADGARLPFKGREGCLGYKPTPKYAKPVGTLNALASAVYIVRDGSTNQSSAEVWVEWTLDDVMVSDDPRELIETRNMPWWQEGNPTVSMMGLRMFIRAALRSDGAYRIVDVLTPMILDINSF